MYKVSIIVPVLNEKNYIRGCLDCIISQDYGKENIEAVFIDGMSDDGTTKIIEEYIKKYDFIKLCQNPQKTVQYALNIGIENATGEYIVRMDAHAWYAPDYVSKCIKCIKETGAQNVGGTKIAQGKGFAQRVGAAAYASPFALGYSKHYKKSYRGYADTVGWGTFKRQYLIDIGMYDKRLPRSEDDDLSFRIIENGGKVYIDPDIKSVYYPKESFKKLYKQYYDYGVWKVAVIKKHHKPARIAHLVPMLFVAFIFLFGLLSFVSPYFAWLYAGVMGLYLILDIYFSFTETYAKGLKEKLGLMYAHFIIHFSYGLGFWQGIFKFWNSRWD